jgi:solute carrier family 35, member C2
MNSLDTSLISTSKRRSPRSATPDKRNSLSLGIQEESKLAPRNDGVDDDMSTSEDVELDDLSEDGLQDDEETGLTGKDRGKRKRRKRRNTLLDQRVAGEVNITAEEKKEANQHVMKNMLINVSLIGLWYILSLSLSIVSSPNSQLPYSS